jgi:hypothetical protein
LATHRFRQPSGISAASRNSAMPGTTISDWKTAERWQ